MSACSSSSRLFVVFPPATASDYVIFGVNSVRPVGEVQDVVYLPPTVSTTESTVKVCFISFVQYSEYMLTCEIVAILLVRMTVILLTVALEISTSTKAATVSVALKYYSYHCLGQYSTSQYTGIWI